MEYSISSSPPEPALSFCSAFLGYYTHAGFLGGLMAEGIRPTQVSGASSGALVAGLTGAGLSPQEMLEFLASREFRRSWLEIKHILTLPLKRLLCRPHTGLTSGKKALACLKQVLGDRRIEECEAVNVSISVTNLTRSRTEIRRSGPLAELIVASCAYPSVIEQQLVDGEWLWDGGIANDGPIGQWLGHPEVPEIFIHSVGIKRLPPKKKNIGVFSGFLRSHDAINAELFRLRQQLAALSGQSIRRWNTPSPRPRAMMGEAAGRRNFAMGMEVGRKAAEEYFAAGKSAGVAVEC